MRPKRKTTSTKAFEKSMVELSSSRCLLRLYVAGASARSVRAIQRARQLCDTEYKGNCDLEVIDVYQQPALARDGQILVTPTLVRELPRPVRRFIGDLSNTAGLRIGLEL